jgi:hypothetical protein
MPRIINLANVTPFQATSLTDPGYIPGPKIIPNCVQIKLIWGLTDLRVGHNILHAQYTGTPALSATVAQAVFAQLIAGAGWTTLAGFLATTASLNGVSIVDLRSSVATEFTSTGAGQVGTGTLGALPDETAAVVTLRTANRGPAGRGRMYLPGWAGIAMGAGGVIAPGAVTALQTWFNTNVFAGVAAAIGPLVLALPERAAYTSPATGRQFPHRSATTLAVSQGVVRDNHWDSQRRRGLK